MLKKLFIAVLFLGTLNAATLQTDKGTYTPNESVTVNFEEVVGDAQNWMAIYSEASSNEWANVIQWTWTGDDANGSHTFQALPVGEYEARVFYNNSYDVEASKKFTVEGVANPVLLTVNKAKYSSNESPIVTFENMSGNVKDWIAIYPAGSTNVWANVIQWKWAGDINGSRTFTPLPVGEYEVRAFFNNTYNLEASQAFSVEAQAEVILETTQAIYSPDERPVLTFKNMSGNVKDWIAIFPAGSSNAWGNVIQWKWAGDINGTKNFNTLPIGNYEIRAFFNNSYNVEATKSFSVENIPVVSTVYEDAENGLNPNWVKVSGNYNPIHYNGGGFQSNGTLVLVPEWKKIDGVWRNNSLYSLALNADASKKVLELDVGGLENYKLPNQSRKGYIPHFNISIWVQTVNGPRRIIWDSFFNHNGITQPFLSNDGQTINSPSPVEHVRGWYKPIDLWQHFKVNIETLVQQFEPNNSITAIHRLTVTGGFLDNIKLSNR